MCQSNTNTHAVDVLVQLTVSVAFLATDLGSAGYVQQKVRERFVPAVAVFAALCVKTYDRTHAMQSSSFRKGRTGTDKTTFIKHFFFSNFLD